MNESEPENLMLQLLRRLDAKVDALGDRLDGQIGATNEKIDRLAVAVAGDMVDMEKRLAAQMVGLRRAVMEYHSSAIGHGMLIQEFEERLRRIEQHVGLSSSEPH